MFMTTDPLVQATANEYIVYPADPDNQIPTQNKKITRKKPDRLILLNIFYFSKNLAKNGI